MSSNAPEAVVRPFRRYRSKTPKITVFYWILKLLASAAGGVLTDLLTSTPGLGLAVTTMLVVTSVAVVMLIQFSAGGYRPRLYWLAVVLLSIFGNLIVDNLTEVLEVPLDAAACACAVLLTGTFIAWYLTERTLSIHTVDTTRRETFYWFAVLLTFTGGSAAQRLAVQVLGLGYGSTAVAAAAVLVIAGIAHRFRRVLVPFWLAYTATQPLGLTLGGFLTEPHDTGGAGLGMNAAAITLLGGLAAVVAYVSRTYRDDPSLDNAMQNLRSPQGS